MRIPSPRTWRFFFSITALVFAATAHADFVVVETFEDLGLGPIGGQSDWTAPSDSSMVVFDPVDGDNRVLSVLTESTYLYKGALLPNGSIRMLFLRFRYENQLNCSFGMSDLAHPSRFDHFEPELSLTNATAELRVNDGGTYDVLTILEPQVWFNCWVLIDNVNDETTIWLHTRTGDSATSADQLDADDGQTVFDFRNHTAGDLQTFYIKTGGGSGVAGPLLLDDIYMEDTNALNLQYPGEAPSATTEPEAMVRVAQLCGYPNPFNPRTMIRYDVSETAFGELGIFDLRGRCVARLASGTMTPGLHEIAWSGRDDTGRPVGSGVYFVRLRSGMEETTTRLHLLK